MTKGRSRRVRGVPSPGDVEGQTGGSGHAALNCCSRSGRRGRWTRVCRCRQPGGGRLVRSWLPSHRCPGGTIQPGAAARRCPLREVRRVARGGAPTDRAEDLWIRPRRGGARPERGEGRGAAWRRRRARGDRPATGRAGRRGRRELPGSGRSHVQRPEKARQGANLDQGSAFGARTGRRDRPAHDGSRGTSLSMTATSAVMATAPAALELLNLCSSRSVLLSRGSRRSSSPSSMVRLSSLRPSSRLSCLTQLRMAWADGSHEGLSAVAVLLHRSADGCTIRSLTVAVPYHACPQAGLGSEISMPPTQLRAIELEVWK